LVVLFLELVDEVLEGGEVLVLDELEFEDEEDEVLEAGVQVGLGADG